MILVFSQRVRQGEVAILAPGCPIRMNAYSLYFLLPTDTQDPPKTMEVPLVADDKSSPSKNKAGSNKRKMPSVSPSQQYPKPSITIKKPKAAPFAQLQAELDAMSRKHQEGMKK